MTNREGMKILTEIEELSEIREKYPKAWAYIMDMMEEKRREGFIEALSPSLPKYNDNDELISAK